MINKIGWICCLSSLIAVHAFAQEYVNLGYNLKKGEQYRLEQTTKTETYITVDGVQQRTSQDFKGKLLLDVAAVLPGKIQFILRYTALQYNFNARNQNIFVDATGPSSKEPLQVALRQLIDHPFTMELQSNGLIDKVEGLDQLLEGAAATLTGLSGQAQKAYKNLLHNQFGNNAFRASMEQLLIIYPAHGIKSGTQWEETLPLRTGMQGRLDFSWHLDQWDGHTAKIGSTSKLKTDGQALFQLEDGMQATAAIEGEIQGNYLIDGQTGMPSLCIQSGEMKGQYFYQMVNEKKLKNPVTVPVRIVTNASFKVSQMQ